MRHIPVLALGCLVTGLSVVTGAQDAVLQPAPADRAIAGRPDGGPFLFDPPVSGYMVAGVLGIGAAAGIPVGFEGAREDPYPDAARIAAAAKGRTRVSLAGQTVRQALDAAIARDPRYHWLEMQGVIVVRPLEAWVDPENPLNKNLGDIASDEMHFSAALGEIFTRLQGILHTGLPPRGPTFSLRLTSATAIDVLNEIARLHGVLTWEAHYNCVGMRGVPNTLEIRLMIPGGSGVGSCSRYKL